MTIYFHIATGSSAAENNIASVHNGMYVPRIGETILIKGQKYLVHDMRYRISIGSDEDQTQKECTEELDIFVEVI
jgi:hypothetical protein